MATVDDDTREFRLALLNDLVAAEGRPGATAVTPAGPDRYRVLFFGAAATAGILAVTLILVLVTGGDSGSKSETTTTQKPVTVATTPGFVTTSINVVDTRLPENVGPNSRITFAKVDGTVVAGNVLVLSVRRDKNVTAGTAVDINVSNEDAVKLRSLNARDLFITVGDAAAVTTTAPPATAPPASTTPSS